jgi:hypothetical protein
MPDCNELIGIGMAGTNGVPGFVATSDPVLCESVSPIG